MCCIGVSAGVRLGTPRMNSVCCCAVQMLPSQKTVDEVIREAQAFWQTKPDEYIAIHCAYGACSLVLVSQCKSMLQSIAVAPFTRANTCTWPVQHFSLCIAVQASIGQASSCAPISVRQRA